MLGIAERLGGLAFARFLNQPAAFLRDYGLKEKEFPFSRCFIFVRNLRHVRQFPAFEGRQGIRHK